MLFRFYLLIFISKKLVLKYLEVNCGVVNIEVWFCYYLIFFLVIIVVILLVENW